MVEVKEPIVGEAVTNEDAEKAWTKFTPRPVIVARLMPKGGTVGGVTIQPGHYAILRDDGTIVALDPVTFEVVFAPA